MRWRRLAARLPLTGVAVAGAVVGHMVAYVVAVPEPSARVALLGATGHAYWTAAIAAAVVLGLTSLATTVWRHFQAGLLCGQPKPEPLVGRLAGHLAALQIAIYLVQEALERIEAGIPLHALLDRRLFLAGVGVQVAIAVMLAVVVAAASRVAAAAGRALRRPRHRLQPVGLPAVELVVVWPSRLLAAGLGSRAPPRTALVL
jgi:hypothetical protein